MSLSNTDYTTPVSGDDCRVIRGILDRVGDKWSLYVILTLNDAPVRFNELRRRITGISQRMLTITLRNLERDGIISRRYFASVPPKVEYTLTSVGRTLLDPVLALVRWADQNQAVISQAQSRYDADARSIETD